MRVVAFLDEAMANNSHGPHQPTSLGERSVGATAGIKEGREENGVGRPVHPNDD